MSANMTLPDVLLDQLTRLAGKTGISIDRFVAEAVSEKLARVEHEDWLLRQQGSAHTADNNGKP